MKQTGIPALEELTFYAVNTIMTLPGLWQAVLLPGPKSRAQSQNLESGALSAQLVPQDSETRPKIQTTEPVSPKIQNLELGAQNLELISNWGPEPRTQNEDLTTESPEHGPEHGPSNLQPRAWSLEPRTWCHGYGAQGLESRSQSCSGWTRRPESRALTPHPPFLYYYPGFISFLLPTNIFGAPSDRHCRRCQKLPSRDKQMSGSPLPVMSGPGVGVLGLLFTIVSPSPLTG